MKAITKPFRGAVAVYAGCAKAEFTVVLGLRVSRSYSINSIQSILYTR